MIRPYLFVFLVFIGLTSCKDDAVELTREQLVVGNWYEYMVTEKYVDSNGNIVDEVKTAVMNPVKISRNVIIRGEHSDAYVMEDNDHMFEKCAETPKNHTIEGATSKYPNWMSWTSEEESVSYQVGNQTKGAAKVIRVIEYKRLDVTK